MVEAFIDSTYKTNKSGLELFVILGTVLGSGYPIAYMFLEAGSREDGSV